MGAAGFARFFLYDLLDERLHWRNVFLSRFPQHLVVDSEVLMDELVSHPGHLLPRNFRMLLAYGRRDLLRPHRPRGLDLARQPRVQPVTDCRFLALLRGRGKIDLDPVVLDTSGRCFL